MSNDLQNVQMDEEQPNKQEVSLPPPPKTKFGERFQKNIILLKAVLGETLCTFLFIFIVTATAYNNSRLSSSQYTSVPLIEALCTGFCSVALIFSFADVSGAHFNPAVSFATFITGKIDILKFLFFVVAQLVGATLASIMLLICYPGWSLRPVKEVVVRRHGEASIYEAFVMEMILTFILVYVIFATAFDKIENQNVKVDLPDDYADLMEEGKQIEAAQSGASAVSAAPKKKKPVMPRLTIYSSGGQFAPIAIGFTLGFLNFIGGTVSGGCYNPARAFGPALIAMEWTDHWIYWIADFLGAGLAGYCQMIFAHNQPDPLALFRPIINFIKKRRGQA